jgi:Single-strand binding protein family
MPTCAKSIRRRALSRMHFFFRQSALSWLPFEILAKWKQNIMSNIGVNKVILLGNAGQNAEVKSTSAGKSVANFSLAINQPFRDKQDGNQRVEWVRCVAWDKLAQIAEKSRT